MVTQTAQFKRDVKLVAKQGKDMERLKAVIEQLAARSPLPQELRDHSLGGGLKSYRECHLEPDWLLIYRIQGNELDLARTLFSCRVVDRLANGVGVDNEEQGEPVAVCTDPRRSWPTLWERLHHLD